jgi:hypothetical protein
VANNNCATCEHKRYPDGGHCYMFREEPVFLCWQHQDRRGKEVRVGTASPEGRATTDATDGVTAVDVTAEDYRQQIEALLELFDSNNAVALRDEFSHARALLAHGASPSAGPTLGAADPDTLENER